MCVLYSLLYNYSECPLSPPIYHVLMKFEHESLPHHVAKLVLENERLGRSLRREMERNQQLQLSLKTAQLERDRLENQVHVYINTATL